MKIEIKDKEKNFLKYALNAYERRLNEQSRYTSNSYIAARSWIKKIRKQL